MTSSIDITTIDATKPIHGNPTTASVRDNMLAIKNALGVAKTEIEAGQAADVALQNLITALQNGKLDASAYNQYFKGLYSTLAALQAAHSTGIAGDYAQVDAGAGEHLQTYSYDLQDGWVLSSSEAVSILNTDQLTEGAANLYFTNARAIAAALTGFVATGDVTASDSLLSAIQKITATIEILKTNNYVTHLPVAPVPQQPHIYKTEGEIVAIDTASGFTSQLTITYSATGLPSGLSIDASTGVISGTLSLVASELALNGKYSVIVVATDTNNAVVANPFILVVLKADGYDLLLHFDEYPIVDYSGRNSIQQTVPERISQYGSFGSWGYFGAFLIYRNSGAFTIPAEFTLKFRINQLSLFMSNGTWGNFVVKDFGGVDLYLNGENPTEGTFCGVAFSHVFALDTAFSIERHTDGIVRLYANGNVIASVNYTAAISRSYFSLNTAGAGMDEVMLKIGVAQAGGANSYVVETVPFA